MSNDPFAVVKVRKSSKALPLSNVKREEEEDDPFAAVKVRRPEAFTQGQVRDVMPLKVGAPSFQQFADAEAELPAAPTPAPKRKYDTSFAEDIAKRQAKPQPAQPQTSYATSDIVGRLARTTKAEANRPVEEFQQQVLDVLKAPLYAARQAVPAVTGMAAPFVEGAYNLLGRPDIAEFTRKTQQDIEQKFAPQSAGETVIGAPLRLAGAFAPYMAAGATAAPIVASAGLSGIQSQAKDGSFVEFLGDKLDNDVLKRIAASKYKTPADMVLDATLGLTFGSLDNIVNAAKTTTSARAALRSQGAEPFVQMSSLIREGVESGALDAATAAPYLKAADKFARQAQGGAGAKAADVVAGLGSSATQFGRNVASNIGAEAKLFSDAGGKLAEQTALSGAQVPIPKKPTQGRLDREEFSSRLGRALDAGDDAEVTRLLERQDEVLSKFAPEKPSELPQQPVKEATNAPFSSADENIGLQKAIEAGDEESIQQLLDQNLAKQLAGKTFDIGGALGEGVSALSKLPGGKAQIAKVGLGGVGYGLSQAEDERLQAHGNALMGLAAYSLVHGKVKQGAKAAGAAVSQELAKSPMGRRVLDEVSLDIRVDPRVKETVDVAMREMAKYRAIGRELAAEAKKRGGVFDRTVSDLVEKEAVETGTLSPEDMEIAIALAQKVADNSLGLKKVEARLMSADTYAKRGTAYLPRRYAKYDSQDVNDVVVQHKGKTFRIGGEKIRNDNLTREERDALGEIREASYRIADYFGRGSKDIGTAHLFEALSEIPGVIHPEYVSAVKEAAVAADLSKVARTPTKAYRGSPTAGKDALRAADEAKARAKGLSEQFKRQGQEYVTLPDTPQLGVLRGAVVRKDAADYLNDLPDFKSTNRLYNRLMHYWKSAHTVFNVPATHLTNLTSNVFMGILGGLPLHEQAVAIPRAIKDIKEYGPTTRFLTEAGVIERALPTYGDTPIKGMARDETVLRGLMKTTRPETRAALESQGLKPMGKLEEAARKAGGRVQMAYSLGDTMFRVALFDKLSKQGIGQEDALKEVMRVFPGYDSRSPALQKLKHISPFVMYPAKYLPAALDLIAENPWRWALASASWAAIDQASRKQAGAVREEDLPPNKRFGKLGYLLPGPIQMEALGLKSKEAGKRLMLDPARYTPFTALTGSAAPGTMASALSETAPAILQPSGPIMDAAARALNVDPFSGEKSIRSSDEPMDKLKKWTVGTTEAGRFKPGFLANFLLPTSLSYHLPNLVKDIAYENDENTKMSMMGLLGGRPIPVKKGQRAATEKYRYEEKMGEIMKDLRKELRAVKDPDVRREIIKEAMEKRRRFAEDYRESRQQGKK